MGWTQPLCEPCWIAEHHTVDLDGSTSVRRPVRSLDTDLEVCCRCGNLTVAGIYVRADPATVPFPKADGPL